MQLGVVLRGCLPVLGMVSCPVSLSRVCVVFLAVPFCLVLVSLLSGNRVGVVSCVAGFVVRCLWWLAGRGGGGVVLASNGGVW